MVLTFRLQEAKNAPDKSYILDLKGAGRTYHVYVHRWGPVDPVTHPHCRLAETQWPT